MISLAVRVTGRRSWAATFLLLAWGVLSSSRADASCGDYVMIGGRHVVHSGVAHDAAEQPLDARERTPSIPRCHGPACSDNSIPPATPAPKIEVAVERWAVSSGTILSELPHRDAVPADATVSPCDGFASGILRPPR